MEDIDFEKFTADIMEEVLLEELMKAIGDDPKAALMFMIGRMVGKFEILKQLHVIYKGAHDELDELVKAIRDNNDDK